jgi:exopolyphosphatase/guanosine-5'-triphosphate,3'-diphosphate pyrophosphatase
VSASARLPPHGSARSPVRALHARRGGLGSNSFRLELGRVEGDQIIRLDTWRENLRVGAGLDRNGRLTAATRRAALACLARFGERLRGIPPHAVRAVATNTFRVARHAREFLPQRKRRSASRST